MTIIRNLEYTAFKSFSSSSVADSRSRLLTTNKAASRSSPENLSLWCKSRTSCWPLSSAHIKVVGWEKFGLKAQTLLNSWRSGVAGKPMWIARPHSIIFKVKSPAKFPVKIFFHSAQIRSPEMEANPPAFSVMAFKQSIIRYLELGLGQFQLSTTFWKWNWYSIPCV